MSGDLVPFTRLRRAAPAVLALIYPELVALGPAVNPAFLLITSVVSIVALVTLRHTPASLPSSRRVALLAAAAPALYPFVSGLLQGAALWWLLWATAAVTAVLERPGTAVMAAAVIPQGRAPGRTLLAAHGLSALLIATFALAHLVNHLGGFVSGQVHLHLMHTLRQVYRQPLIEPLLLAAVGFQAASGAVLLWRRVPRIGTWPDTLQAGSGGYLLAFFVAHVTAVLRARLQLGIDTDWHWLVGRSLLHDPWVVRLLPYYGLSVIALGLHAGLGLRQLLVRRSLRLATVAYRSVAGAAIAAAVLIVLGLIGVQLHPAA